MECFSKGNKIHSGSGCNYYTKGMICIHKCLTVRQEARYVMQEDLSRKYVIKKI